MELAFLDHDFDFGNVTAFQNLEAGGKAQKVIAKTNSIRKCADITLIYVPLDFGIVPFVNVVLR